MYIYAFNIESNIILPPKTNFHPLGGDGGPMEKVWMGRKNRKNHWVCLVPPRLHPSPC